MSLYALLRAVLRAVLRAPVFFAAVLRAPVFFAAVVVLESGHITMAAPSLGCIATDGDFYYIGNAGWTRFEDRDGQPSAPRSVPIFRTKLPKPKK